MVGCAWCLRRENIIGCSHAAEGSIIVLTHTALPAKYWFETALCRRWLHSVQRVWSTFNRGCHRVQAQSTCIGRVIAVRLNLLCKGIGVHQYLKGSSRHSLTTSQMSEPSPPLVVSGPSGSGKSALLANWLLHYRRRLGRRPKHGGPLEEPFIFCHAVGQVPKNQAHSYIHVCGLSMDLLEFPLTVACFSI